MYKRTRKRQMLRAKLQHYRRWRRYAGVWAYFKERGIKVSPIKLGRMNGKCLGFSSVFSTIDEAHREG